MKRCALIVMLLVVAAPLGSGRRHRDIWGCQRPGARANVLIISTPRQHGTQDIPGEPYDSAANYNGSYSRNAVYQRSGTTRSTIMSGSCLQRRQQSQLRHHSSPSC